MTAWKTTYSEKLRDPRWQRRRLEVLNRAGFCCQLCYDSETELHVHHNLYRRKTDPWDYPDHELRVLCKPCHQSEEQSREDLLSILGVIPPEYPLAQILGAVKEIIRRGEEWDFHKWIMCANHRDLMAEAMQRRVIELYSEDYAI